jgi:hypothetical protein
LYTVQGITPHSLSACSLQKPLRLEIETQYDSSPSFADSSSALSRQLDRLLLLPLRGPGTGGRSRSGGVSPLPGNLQLEPSASNLAPSVRRASRPAAKRHVCKQFGSVTPLSSGGTKRQGHHLQAAAQTPLELIAEGQPADRSTVYSQPNVTSVGSLAARRAPSTGGVLRRTPCLKAARSCDTAADVQDHGQGLQTAW